MPVGRARRPLNRPGTIVAGSFNASISALARYGGLVVWRRLASPPGDERRHDRVLEIAEAAPAAQVQWSASDHAADHLRGVVQWRFALYTPGSVLTCDPFNDHDAHLRLTFA